MLSFGSDPFDESIDTEKYSFVADKNRGIYYLIVKNVKIEDSGEYRLVLIRYRKVLLCSGQKQRNLLSHCQECQDRRQLQVQVSTY